MDKYCLKVFRPRLVSPGWAMPTLICSRVGGCPPCPHVPAPMIFQSLKIAHRPYVKATYRQSVLIFYSTEFLFPNSKAIGIMRKSVQAIVICRRSPTNTAVSWHFDARIPLETLLSRLPKSFVFNRYHRRNYLSTNDLVN